ncbi:hypothetical protein GGQ02_003357, partial [Salinibacter ruber]|nr:hypothetical protein [Salinibacter ruber]
MGDRSGQYILTSSVGEEVRAFVPDPLPPPTDLDLKAED